MTGEISIGGVFVPTLLVLVIVALVLTGLLLRVVTAVGLHRFFVYRAAVDLAFFVLILGLLVFLLTQFGIRL
jgi:hypothetical protein